MTNQLGLLLCVCLLLVASQVFLKLALRSGTLRHATGVVELAPVLLVPTFWLALVATASAGILWLIVIRSAPLSQVYPTISLSYVLMIPVARLVLGEAVTFERLAGAAIIVAGVVVLSRSL